MHGIHQQQMLELLILRGYSLRIVKYEYIVPCFVFDTLSCGIENKKTDQFSWLIHLPELGVLPSVSTFIIISRIYRMEQWMRALTCAGYEYMKLMVAELQRQLNEIERSKGKDVFFRFSKYLFKEKKRWILISVLFYFN